MTKSIAISVRNLTKTYKIYSRHIDRLKEALNPLKRKYHKEFYALKCVNFDIKRGETVGIIGRNGSGKSTLLKAITGVIGPTSGHVVVRGRISAILELGAGFNNELTGIENIYLSNTINGVAEKEIAEKVQQIIDFAELGEFINQPLKTYSSGMKARLAFGVAINIKPDILIVDEALSVGDASFQRKCFAKMEEIRKVGATILFVSHSESNIVSLCNRAIWLAHGEKILDGDPKLVTGMYLKNINSEISKEKLQAEYSVLDKAKVSEASLNLSFVPDHEHLDDTMEGFDPQLLPRSTISYEDKGAKIYDVKVTNLAGDEVNILEHKNDYFFKYKVRVEKELNQVKFGFLVKQKNGVAIAGAAYPSTSEFIDTLSHDIEVNYKFRCDLANGDYFFNAGIQANAFDRIDYVHRILDAYMVKVVNADKRMTGNVNLIKDISVKVNE